MSFDESRKRSYGGGGTCNKGAPPDDAGAPASVVNPMQGHPSAMTSNDTDRDSRHIKHQRLLESTSGEHHHHHLGSTVSPATSTPTTTLMAKESSVSSSGSGTDDLCGGGGGGGASSSSGNPGVVTASTAPTNHASSLSGDERSSSESAQGSSSAGNGRRGGGEAAEEYYCNGYGAVHHHHHHLYQHQVDNILRSNYGGAVHPSSVSSLAAAEAAEGTPQQHQLIQPSLFHHGPGTGNNDARHVVVATDEGGGLPPPSLSLASHLRHHHARYSNHNHRSNNTRGTRGGEDPLQGQRTGMGDASTTTAENIALHQAPTMSSAPTSFNGIPFAISGPASQRVRHHRYRSANTTTNQHQMEQISSTMPSSHYELRLPQSDEQAVLQRVPRTHATVVAQEVPPPPTSSDAWSSSSSGKSSRSRRRASTVASTGHSNNGRGTVVADSISGGNTSSQPTTSFDSPQALLVDHPHDNTTSSQSGTSDDSSDGAKSETDAMGSGSDEGYAASSERQSGSGSGSDSTSSDYSKKGKGSSTRGGGNGGGVSLLKVGVSMASRSDSKRTETSSMSSSVLADFSSGMNDELSRSDSPRSSNTSLSSNGGNDNMDGANNTSNTENNGGIVEGKSSCKAPPTGTKRDAARLQSSLSDKARKKSKIEQNAKSCAADGFVPPTNAMKSGLTIMEKFLQQRARSANHHHYHSRSTGRKMLEKSFLSAKRDLSTADAATAALASSKLRADVGEGNSIESSDLPMGGLSPYDEASIYSLGQDVMAQVVAFLEPPEIQSFLTTPLSKTWLVAYTEPQGLWKILCTSKPFYAKLDECDSDVSDCSFPMCNDMEMRHLFGRYRLLYTSFVRCMKYLNRLQDDALNGRTPSLNVNSDQNDIYPYNKNASLKAYFAKARRLMRSSSRNSGSRSSSDAALSITSESGSLGSDEKVLAEEERTTNNATEAGKVGASANGASKQNNQPSRQLGRSMLTDRLLRPTRGGNVDNINLPWSCAIYSVVNWMVAFADVEGIQVSMRCVTPLSFHIFFSY